MGATNRLLECLKRALVAGPASDAEIRSAEEKLGVRLPPSYIGFLKVYGAALCEEFEVFGLFTEDASETPQWSHLITSNMQVRRVLRDRIPNDYVFISDDGGDYSFYLDTGRANADGECPVIVLGPGADAKTVADTFNDFVVRAFGGNLEF